MIEFALSYIIVAVLTGIGLYFFVKYNIKSSDITDAAAIFLLAIFWPITMLWCICHLIVLLIHKQLEK